MRDALELAALGLGIILIAVSWHFIRQTLADLARDSLFDLRDQVRDRFAKEGLLGHDAYKELRSLVNGYLANIERVSLTAVVVFAVIRRNEAPPLQNLPSKGAIDGDIKSFIRYTIDRANATTHKYLILSSPIVAVAGLPLLIWASHCRRRASALKHNQRPAVAIRSRDRVRVRIRQQKGFSYPREPINQYAQAFAEESAQMRTECDSRRRELAPA